MLNRILSEISVYSSDCLGQIAKRIHLALSCWSEDPLCESQGLVRDGAQRVSYFMSASKEETGPAGGPLQSEERLPGFH